MELIASYDFKPLKRENFIHHDKYLSDQHDPFFETVQSDETVFHDPGNADPD
jgi:hypothetical protein